MTGNLKPIPKDSELCQVLTCLPEKFIVDFANGIDVTRDHLRVQRGRQGMFARLYDGFTGKGARRQAEINSSLADGVEASLTWLCELSEELAQSNLAISRVNDRVSTLAGNMTALVHYSADTRHQLEQLAQRMDARSHALEREVGRIDFIQKVQINLDQVFDKWEAGRFGTVSLIARSYAALEELRWGAFGDYCRQHTGRQRDGFIQQAIDKTIARLAAEAETGSDDRLEMRGRWLALPGGRNAQGDMSQALMYLSDGFDVEAAPFITSIARKPDEWPLTLPKLSSAKRIAEAVVQEVFTENINA